MTDFVVDESLDDDELVKQLAARQRAKLDEAGQKIEEILSQYGVEFTVYAVLPPAYVAVPLAEVLVGNWEPHVQLVPKKK